MARTGVMFLISGIFLIVFGVYLEKRRRALMKQIQSQNSEATP
jgi:sulfite exporter TauE/SafE